MPKALEDAVKKIKATGKSTSSAYAIATAALQKSGKLPYKGNRTKKHKDKKAKK